MKAGGFCSRGMTAFFDVRVTRVNSKTNQGKSTAAIFKEQVGKKKRKYQQRVLKVERVPLLHLFLKPTEGWEKNEKCS